MKSLSIIIPSFHSREVLAICLKSIIKYYPKQSIYYPNIIVVENSNDVSYKEEMESIAKIIWINNDSGLVGSDANADAIEVGLKYICGELVLILHCDICILSGKFFTNFFSKIDDGYKLVGTYRDTERIKALHISGVMTTSLVAKNVKYAQVTKVRKRIRNNRIVFRREQALDVGDSLTAYCEKRKLPIYCFRNTFRDDKTKQGLPEKCQIRLSMCINEENEPIFAHLGRGIPKTNNTYTHEDGFTLDMWKEFTKEYI